MTDLEEDPSDEESYLSASDVSEDDDDDDDNDLWSYLDESGNVLEDSAKSPPAAAAKITSTGVQLLVQRHDVVLLRSDEGDPYIGLVKEFGMDPDTDTRGFNVLWMERPASFNPDTLPKNVQDREIFVTDKSDWNPLSVILGRATVLSYADYKVERARGDDHKGTASSTFFCRRACLVTESRFSRLFDWYEWYNQSKIDYDFIAKLVSGRGKIPNETGWAGHDIQSSKIEPAISKRSLTPPHITSEAPIGDVEESPSKRRRRLRNRPTDDNQPIPTVSLLMAQHRPAKVSHEPVELSEDLESPTKSELLSTPEKRKRGRPRKDSPQRVTPVPFKEDIQEEQELHLSEVDQTPTKRKRGRPRKTEEQSVVAQKPSSTVELLPDNVNGHSLRQQSRKVDNQPKELSEEEDKDQSASVQTPTKRGRGRPRKSISTDPIKVNHDSEKVDQENNTGALSGTTLDLSSITPTKIRIPGSRSLPVTPSHRTPTPRKKNVAKLTPLPSRTFSPANSASPYWAARTRLHVSAVPDTLPCRESEFNEIYVTLEAAVKASTGCCVYISGTPGTGKTATVRQVMASLELASQTGNLEKFLYLEINGLKVTDPTKAYEQLWELIANENLQANSAVRKLEDRFNNPRTENTPIVVLMDELDQLVTKNQTVMYNFFNWPSLPHSHLIVVAVANTMDLPERTLSNKISSRLGLTRIQFPGYTFEQLKTIIATRLKGFIGTTISPEAIEFASRKIASVSGDARRALDICRRAVELADPDLIDMTPSKKVGRNGSSSSAGTAVKIEHIRNAINEATSSPLNQSLKALPLASKIFLRSLLSISNRTGLAEVIVENILQECDRICKTGSQAAQLTRILYRDDKVRFQGFFSAAVQLQSAGIIAQQRSRSQMQAKVKLIVDHENVNTILKPDFEKLR